jgi:hypothetical protein
MWLAFNVLIEDAAIPPGRKKNAEPYRTRNVGNPREWLAGSREGISMVGRDRVRFAGRMAAAEALPAHLIGVA